MPEAETGRAVVGGPLDHVNDLFHDAYDAGRSVAKRDPPVIVVCADSIVLFRDQERLELPFTPRVFHIIKSVAHVPIALFTALVSMAEDPTDPGTQRRMRALREHVTRALGTLDQDAPAKLAVSLRNVLEISLAHLDHVLSPQPTWDTACDELPRQVGPLLQPLIEEATRVQLAALHTCVQAALARLDEVERRTLQVVVTGDHQARRRSLGVQYFCKLLGEAEGEEERVSYAEGVTDVDEARALVGTRRLDRAIAEAFFGDPKRMQRDLLGDAVQAELAKLELNA